MQGLEKMKDDFIERLTRQRTFFGNVPEVEKFVEFWGGIWEQERTTKEQPWMLETEEQLKDKIQYVEEFKVIVDDISKVLKKRKNCTSPGVEGIQNYWWKRFKETWNSLCKTMQIWKQDMRKIPEWIAWGRCALLPKTENLSPVKDYRPITCLNTSYKTYTGLMAKYLMNHATRNMWDEGQMGTSEGTLGTVDLLIDKCIIDEEKEHNKNLTVA